MRFKAITHIALGNWYYFLFFSSLFIGIFDDYLAVIMKEFISDCFKETYKFYLNSLLYNQSCQIPPFKNSIAIFLNDMRQYLFVTG